MHFDKQLFQSLNKILFKYPPCSEENPRRRGKILRFLSETELLQKVGLGMANL